MARYPHISLYGLLRLLSFNPVIPPKFMKSVTSKEIISPYKMAKESGAPDNVCKIFRSGYDSSNGDHETCRQKGWAAVHKAGYFKNKQDRWVQRKFDMAKDKTTNFQTKKETPPDPRDNHVHQAAFDEDGNGGTSEAGDPSHVHSVFGFKVQPYFEYDEGTEYVSVHPGSLAFCEGDDMPKTGDSPIEMEIFRAGTHNKMEFDEADLEEMAANFHALKAELRPKLKITHREHQEKIAGLASYGDVTDVYTRAGADGKKRLFAKVSNVPQEVASWIKDRRFPERSIELYPEFQLGTEDNSPVYKNVLKAIALLGQEMPAVTGMAPIMLEECIECQGTVCVRVFSQKIEKDSAKSQVPDELRVAFEALDASIRMIE